MKEGKWRRAKGEWEEREVKLCQLASGIQQFDASNSHLTVEQTHRQLELKRMHAQRTPAKQRPQERQC